jgi:hypothetical protein
MILCFPSCAVEEYSVLEYDTVLADKQIPTFWNSLLFLYAGYFKNNLYQRNGNIPEGKKRLGIVNHHKWYYRVGGSMGKTCQRQGE